MKSIFYILLTTYAFSCFAQEAKDLQNAVQNVNDTKPASEISPLGIWLVGDKDAKVEIYQNGENIEGKIVWLKEPNDSDNKPKTDFKNPDKKLAERKIMGLVFLTGFKKEKNENKWVDGQLYDAKTGNNYKGWLQLVDDKKMKLRGYVGISLFGRTDEWTRDSL